MDTANFPIHAYLSYRCKIGRDIQARKQLEGICGKHHMTLKYDQNCTEQGDSLIEFMDDLSSARCVFLFISPEYFQSAYTLFELVSIHEWADLDRRFILPLRLCDNIVDKYRTGARDFWLSPQAEADRDKLADMLNQDDHTALWQRIDAAWEAIIKPYLNELHPSLESDDGDKLLSDLLVNARQEVASIIREAKQQMLAAVSSNIEQILKNQHIPVYQLAKQLRLDSSANNSDIAKQLLDGKKVGEALDVLYKLSIQQEKKLSARPDEWRDYLYDVEQIGGWLLLKTVDPLWWFHNQLSLDKAKKRGITGAFNLQHPAYVEVIIARSLLQRAQHSLDEYGSIKPASEEHDVMLFDAISPDASDYQLLFPIYKDIRRADKAPQDISLLRDKIELTLRSLSGSRDGKPIYYIVSQDYLEQLKARDWFAGFEQRLVGYLQFVCCIQEPHRQNPDPCLEEQSLLLEKVANILRLKNTKRSTHD
jgi:hypothetical protein